MEPTHDAQPYPPQPGELLTAEQLLDALPWGVLVVDAHRIIRRANQQAARWCGASPEALLGRPLAEADLPPAVRAALLQLLEEDGAPPREVFLPKQAQWITLAATRQPSSWVLHGHDITPRKQREQQYQALADNTPDVLTRWTPDLRLRYANAAFATKAGQPISSLLGCTFEEMGVAADITGPYMAALQRVFATGQPQEHYNPFPGPHGTVYFYSRLVPELRDGAIETVLGIARDITELKQTQAEALHLRDELMQHATDQYHALFYTMDQGFCVLEVLFDEASQQAVDFRYLELNPVFARQSGMPADALGKTVRDFLPDLEPFWFDTYGGVARTGNTVRVEHYVPQLGRWFDVHAFRVGAPEANRVAVLFNDITKRKQREANLAFLADLNVDFAPLLSTEQIMAHVSERLADYLRLSRCHLAVVDEQADYLKVVFDWRRAAEHLPPLLGTYHIAEYLTAAGRSHIEAGHPLVLRGQAPSPLVSAPLDVLAQMGFGSSVDIPLVTNGRWRFLLTVARTQSSSWRPDEVELLLLLAARIYTRLERAQTEAALQEAHAQLVDVFESTHDAFYALDAALRFSYVNQEAAERWGRESGGLLGQSYWQEFPQAVGSESYHQHYKVLRTGQPAHFETVSPVIGTWVEVSIYPSRQGGLSVFFRDISARKHAEERQAFLLRLSDALRPLAEPTKIQSVASQLLGEQLHLDRCGYAEVQADNEHAAICCDYYVPDNASVAGTYRMDDFGPDILAAMRRGDTLAIDDVAEDVATADPLIAAAYATNGVRAFVAVPLMKHNRLIAILFAHHRTPRRWTPAEVALLEEVAERTWAVVERSQAEKARHESEQRLRAVMENLPGTAVFIVDAARRYQLAEGEVLRQAGHEPASFVGRSMQEMVPPGLWPNYQRLYQQALAGHSFEYEHAQGGRTFATRGGPLRNADGSVAAVLAVSYDITARQQAEEALRLSEARLSLALQAGRMGSFEWTSDGNRISLSAMSEEVLGLLPGAVVATSEKVFELVHPDDRARHQAVFEQAGRSGEDFHSIFRIVRPLDGEVRWIEERGHGAHDLAASGVCLRGVHWDVTETMQAQQQLSEFNRRLAQRVARRTRDLQASRDLLQSVFDTSLLAISVMEAVRDDTGAVQDFRLQLVSRELTREAGRTDLVGKLYAAEYPGIREVGIFDLAVRAMETGEPHGMEYYYNHEGFDKWFACQFVKLGDGVVATNLDITERKAAEQERMKNLRLLEQAEAVAGLGSWDYELATNTMRWSDGMYHLFGLPVGSAVAPATYLTVVVPEHRVRAKQLVRRLTAAAGDFEETLRLRVGDRVKTVRMRIVVFHDGQGQAVRVLGVDLDISELQRLEHDNLRLRLRQQRALFEAVQVAQEAERKRMAESLHNGIGQILYATKLCLDRLHAPVLGTDPVLSTARHEADQLLSEAIRQTRALSHELVPMVLAEFGLAAALKDVCRKMSSPQLRLRCSVQFDDEAALLAPALQMALYRMAQELVQNIVKHATGATEASLELETMPGWVMLRAEDDGPGFSLDLAEAPGLGLRSIRDRVALLGGQLEIGTALTGGAYVRIRIPLPVPSSP